MCRLRWLPLLCLALTSSVWPQNDERILRYHSDITVNPDGSMDVRETIKVRARGQQIKRGIYRDFPTTYQDRFGQLQRVDFQLREVLRDGQPDGSRIVAQGNGVRVYVGKADVFLPPGEYTYTLAYRTTKQVSFFKDHDELYWNVTGNAWVFFIDQASAIVTLPGKVPRRRIRLEGYTGPQGAKGQDFTSKVSSDGKSSFGTTKMLPPQAGLTIVVSFPKGLVAPPKPVPTPLQQSQAPPVQVPAPSPQETKPVETWQAVVAGLLGPLMIFGYYMTIWRRVGRDPEGGAIMPLYEPPEDLSPAVIRYITRNEFDDKTFAAAVLDMAVKGHIAITDESGTYTIVKKGEGAAGLSEDEKVVSANLLDSSGSIVLQLQNHARIRAALLALEQWLKSNQEKVYFYVNRRYVRPGMLLTAVALFAFLMLLNLDPGHGPGAFLISIPFAGLAWGTFHFGVQAAREWKMVMSSAGNGSLRVAFSKSVFTVPFLAGAWLLLWGFSEAISVFAAGVLAAMAAINGVFSTLLDAPTKEGRRALDQIAGFKMFLTAVEGDRLRMLGAEDRTPQLFEKYLPYALALDVEHQWAEQFSEIFGRAATAGSAGQRDGDFSPSWYSSRKRKPLSASDFASSVARPIVQAAAVSSAPRSGYGRSSSSSSGSSLGRSSGSSGRGSSGGGGGGGGGGGW